MEDGARVLQSLHFETIVCYKCNMPFAVPTETKWRWQTSGGTFYCPAGHGQVYKTTENERLQNEVTRLNKRLQWELTNSRHLEASLRSQKAAKTKLKKRIANGVCPCCHRSFVNLKRHMETQHKEYGE